MSSSKVTSLDVADRAGVSRSAVSRVFTPGASVSKKTAAKVREAAEALGYRPNALARSLLTGRSRIIGLVVAYLDNHFYPTALEKLSNALEAQGYHVLVFMASNKAGDIEAVATEILDYQVDGLVLASVAMTSDLAEKCRAQGVPVALFNRRQGDAGELAIVSDNRAGGEMAADYVVDRGFTRIGYIAGWNGASTQAEREDGFTSRLAARGRSLFARGTGDFDPERAKDAAREMFSADTHPDVVFVANDYMAFQVMDVLRFELGLKIPQDVAVIGFDNVPTASWAPYDLTTIEQNAEAMIELTVKHLIAAINGTRLPSPAPVPVRLIERGST